MSRLSQKISSLKDILSRPIEEVLFNIKSLKELNEISQFLKIKGDTLVKIKIQDEVNRLNFNLENKLLIHQEANYLILQNIIHGIS